MNKVIVALFSLLAGIAVADPVSVHGMLIFGQQKIYVSHLPMYHSPHDYQLIMEVSLGNDGAKLKTDMVAHPEEGLYTIEPKSFVLPTMVKDKASFSATVYRGHFERGGVPLFQATVQPTSVLFFKKLKATEATPKALSLLLFGTVQEAFVAHLITSRPNFDQVVKVSGLTAGNLAQIEKGQGTLGFTVPTETDKASVKQGQTVEGAGVSLTVQKEIYLEHGDLE